MREISETEVLGRLEFDNPWWERGRHVAMPFQEAPRRTYFESFLGTVKERSVQRAVVLMGPRRVGKTVMVHHAIRALLDAGTDGPSILYLSLETPLLTGLALERLVGLFRDKFGHDRDAPLFVFFDEIQYLKDWEVHLKSLVDSYPAYKFVATGSAAAALRLKSRESGAGRFSDYVLPPLTFAEYLRFIGRDGELIQEVKGEKHDEYVAKDIAALNEEFVSYLNFGGYPEAVFSQTVRRAPEQYIKSDIIDKVLLRDLPSLYGISDIQELNRLFTTLAYNTGNEVSLEGLSTSAGIAKNTIKRYMDYLEAAFLIRRVERVDHSARRFQRARNFKVYLTNPSMRAALFGHIGPDSEAIGALTETAVYSQWQHFRQADLFYARWADGEVDIVCVSQLEQKPLWITEVKWSDRPFSVRSELDNCVEFVRRNDIRDPVIVTTRTINADVEHSSVRFELRPASLHAFRVGANLLNQVTSLRQ